MGRGVCPVEASDFAVCFCLSVCVCLCECVYVCVCLRVWCVFMCECVCLCESVYLYECVLMCVCVFGLGREAWLDGRPCLSPAGDMKGYAGRAREVERNLCSVNCVC